MHFKSFADSTADFVGLTSKLDYLQTLGVDCPGIQPMHLSPIRDNE